MSNHRILFYGTENGTEEHTLEVYVNTFNEIWVSIEVPDYPPSFITLDKSTAIKFAKTLRTEINKIKEDETN